MFWASAIGPSPDGSWSPKQQGWDHTNISLLKASTRLPDFPPKMHKNAIIKITTAIPVRGTDWSCNQRRSNRSESRSPGCWVRNIVDFILNLGRLRVKNIQHYQKKDGWIILNMSSLGSDHFCGSMMVHAHFPWPQVTTYPPVIKHGWPGMATEKTMPTVLYLAVKKSCILRKKSIKYWDKSSHGWIIWIPIQFRFFPKWKTSLWANDSNSTI